MGKETDKTGYDFHSGCLRNQSMYSVIARSIVYSGRIPLLLWYGCCPCRRWAGAVGGVPAAARSAYPRSDWGRVSWFLILACWPCALGHVKSWV